MVSMISSAGRGMRVPCRRCCSVAGVLFAWHRRGPGWHDRRMAAELSPGTELCARYYQQVIRPLLGEHVPGLWHSAALVGWGSEVLGFDTARSTDHNWGLRCQLFVGTADSARI